MATQGMEAGNILFGQLVTAQGITMLEASSMLVIPPIYKIELIDFRKKLLHGEFHCTAATLREWDFELIDCYLDIIDNIQHPKVPKLHNTDGEPLEMHRLVFDIDSPEDVLDALKSLDVDRSEEDIIAAKERTVRGEFMSAQLNWTKAGNQMHESWSNTIVGQIEIKTQRVVAEVNSARRARESSVSSRSASQVRRDFAPTASSRSRRCWPRTTAPVQKVPCGTPNPSRLRNCRRCRPTCST